MKHTRIFKILTVLFAVVLCLGSVVLAGPVGTAFTYQGRLIDSNNAADGLYDFQFKLFDADSNGNQLGTDVNEPNFDVIDGYFTVELDYGNVFDGNNRWLEIGVRPGVQNDPNAYTSLTPRQKITPTPYALYAKNGGGAGSGSPWQVNGTDIYYNTGNVGIGTTSPVSKLDVNGVINTASTYQIRGNSVLSAGTDFTLNTLIGLDAGENTTGQYNTFSGYAAGYNTTTGGRNTFSGFQAGYHNTTGQDNTFSGSYTGYSNTTGFYNTFSGYAAGYSNTTGSGNVFLGYKAGYSETGSNKLYIANSSGTPLIYGDFNTGNVGIGTMSPAAKLDVSGDISAATVYRIGGSTVLSIAGTGNTLIGVGAGPNNTGIYNTFSGYQAGFSNTTGYLNTFSGYQAGYSNTTGNDNTFSGMQAGYSNTTGNANTFLGEGAGYSNTTSSDNTFTGAGAGNANTTGSDNTFTGISAGSLNTTGNYNTFLGGGAGQLNTSGYSNTFSGYWAGRSNTTGNVNTFSGDHAGYHNTTGSDNTFSGFSAGSLNTTGNDNTFLGENTGYSNTTGSSNTYLGRLAGFYSTGSGNVFIGYKAGYNETGSSKLYIANTDVNTLIYGDFTSKTVGINTSAPAGFTLAVNGTAAKTGGGSWSVFSDRRLKKNIHPLAGTLGHILQLHGVSFEYSDPCHFGYMSGEQTGMVAQEVEQVFPDWVSKDTDGYKYVTFRGFEALTVEALRDLRAEKDAQIESLKKENEDIKARLAAMESIISKLAQQEGDVK